MKPHYTATKLKQISEHFGFAVLHYYSCICIAGNRKLYQI